ncbi:MAG: hypothetical protein K2G70_01860 [Turicibacter sp.]|nr:hypothetical protein [Turicibacter sp.]
MELEKILTMLETGVIKSEEAQRLIQVLNCTHQKSFDKAIGRFLRIDIDNYGEDETVVGINLPLTLACSVFNLGFIQKQVQEKIGLESMLELEKILSSLHQNYIGDLMIVKRKDTQVRIRIA